MMAYIKIKDYTNKNAVCLPINTVQSDQDGKFVFIASQNGNEWTAKKQMVKTGMDYNGTVEVLEGISSGDKIITSGFQNLNPDEKIIF
jgi:multidrug efflux pump subunit AcrA (membrane-fusion protein)